MSSNKNNRSNLKLGEIKIKRVLLAEAQHRRLHSAFGWVRPNCLVLVVSLHVKVSSVWNLYRQEEQGEAAAAGTGEDPCHLTAYNRRLQATQSPNNKQDHSHFNHEKTQPHRL